MSTLKRHDTIISNFYYRIRKRKWVNKWTKDVIIIKQANISYKSIKKKAKHIVFKIELIFMLYTTINYLVYIWILN